jgi:predicted permease
MWWIGDVGKIWRKLQFFFHRSQLERDLAEEMRLHAELKAHENLMMGMPVEEARFAAKRQLGNLTQQREQSRQHWGFPSLESVLQDVRYGARGLRNSPGFSLVAIATLALGIGATTAIFSVVNAVLLRPLPYKDSTRIMDLWTVSPMFPDFHMGQSIPNLNDIRSRSHAFELIAAYQPQTTALTGNGAPERLFAAPVTADFFSLFSVHPILGRGILPQDETGKDGNVVWLSYGLWQRRYAGDQDIAGRSISLDAKPYVVAGVMPKSFDFPDGTEVWKPLLPSAEERRNRSSWMYYTIAKLKPGISPAQAQSELNNIAAQIARENQKDAEGIGFSLKLLQDDAVARDSRKLLLMLLTAVGFLLLIACANVSNLILSRSIQRQREIAVRAALGASRLRIVRQLLLESLVLSLAGGLCGLAAAMGGVRAFQSLAPNNFARLHEVAVSPWMAAIAFIIASATGIICGLAPAVQASRPDLNLSIKENTSAPAGKGRFSLRSTLAVTEVALALVLLTGAALMAQSIIRQLRVDAGFRTDHVLTAKLHLNLTNYLKDDAQRIFIQKLLAALRAQPGAGQVGISNTGVMEGSSLMSLDPAVSGISDKIETIQVRSITPGFLETMGIRLLAGRLFNDGDTNGAPKIMIVNQAMVRRYFAGKNPLGRTLRISSDSKDGYEIVGVVSDTRDIRPGLPARPQIYFSILQDPLRTLYVVIRSQADTASLTSMLQASVWSVDKDLPVNNVKTMAEVVSATVSVPKFHTWLLIAFAGVGLLLTLIGIYGVMSYSVSQRTHEIGIRAALGAEPRTILLLVLNQGAKLAFAGATIGLLGAWAVMRLLSSQLYEIKPGDPLTLICTALVMLAVALGASYIPARRATKVDPITALRYE